MKIVSLVGIYIRIYNLIDLNDLYSATRIDSHITHLRISLMLYLSMLKVQEKYIFNLFKLLYIFIISFRPRLRIWSHTHTHTR